VSERFNIVYQQYIAIVRQCAVNGPDWSRVLLCHHTKVPCHR